jgi:Ras-related GTP-binding protein A/B
VLIFVFDVTSKDFAGDLAHYESCLSALSDLSKQAKIFVLVHKMDLIQD